MRFLRLLFPIFILATGCKQQIGDRCQVNGDCAEGRCSADNVCRLDTGTVSQDSGPADASIDAALDNPSDAAPSTPDARAVDAAQPDAT